MHNIEYSKLKEQEELKKKIEEWLAKGNQIKQIPIGESAEDPLRKGNFNRTPL